METSSRTPSHKNPLRELIRWIIEREDIAISTVVIEYFKKGGDDTDPIVLKFGHKSALKKGRK